MKTILLITLTLLSLNLSAETTFENVLCGTIDEGMVMDIDWDHPKTRAVKEAYITTDEFKFHFSAMPMTPEILEDLQSAPYVCVTINKFPEVNRFAIYFLEVVKVDTVLSQNISHLTRLNDLGRMELVEFTKSQERMIISYVDFVKKTGVENELVLELQNKILSVFESGARSFARTEEAVVLLYYTLVRKTEFDVKPMITALTPYLGIKSPGSKYPTPAADIAEVIQNDLKTLLD